jgi:hypothetical protein
MKSRTLVTLVENHLRQRQHAASETCFSGIFDGMTHQHGILRVIDLVRLRINNASIHYPLPAK